MAPKPSRKRRADGRFRVYAEGKYFYSTVSYADAERQAKAYRQQVKDGMANAQNITVRNYAAKWLPLHKSHVSDRTYNSYAGYINQLIACLGDYACMDVTPDDAKRVFVKCFPPKKKQGDKEGYSGSAIRKAKMLYVAIFDSAVENNICRRNPFRTKSAQPVMGEDGTHRQITQEERQLIHQSEHWFKPAVMAMLYAGLRRGEAIAVDIGRDVTADASWLSVAYAVRYDSNQPIVGDPKTKKGVRMVPIFALFRPYVEGKTGLLVSSRNSGSVMSESSFSSAWESFVLSVECQMNNVTQKRWYGLTKEAQKANPKKYARIIALKSAGKHEEAEALRLSDWIRFDVRPHDLRHSYCTMLRDAGVDIKQAIEWMGHADEKMILKIYDHPGIRRASDSIKKVENLCELGQ